MKGSAAEALGLIGDPAAADAHRRAWSTQIVESGALAEPPADDATIDARHAGRGVPARVSTRWSG